MHQGHATNGCQPGPARTPPAGTGSSDERPSVCHARHSADDASPIVQPQDSDHLTHLVDTQFSRSGSMPVHAPLGGE
ncbi:hypothetical protein ON010_g17879 [Phytophthora cinnamomi]|nr:hypothetical protein ON010_g17879 [Phytophthora cinnamomi]